MTEETSEQNKAALKITLRRYSESTYTVNSLEVFDQKMSESSSEPNLKTEFKPEITESNFTPSDKITMNEDTKTSPDKDNETSAPTKVVIKEEKIDQNEEESLKNDGNKTDESHDSPPPPHTQQPTVEAKSEREQEPDRDKSRTSDDEDEVSDAETVAPISGETETKPPHPVISVRKTSDLMVSRLSVNGSEEKYPILPQFPQAPIQPPPVENHFPQTAHLGSGVVLSQVQAPAPPPPPVPNLPPGIQLSKRPAPSAPELVPSAPKRSRDDLERRLPESITLSRPAQPPRSSVADMLANRGITVVPSARQPPPPPAPVPPALPRNLSSAISITPSSQAQRPQPQSNFAVPQARQVSRLLTVDLTQEKDPPPRRSVAPPPPPAARGRMRGMSTRCVCQICDKAFPTQQELQHHMACHRGGASHKVAFECRECTAQYPTEAGLQAHRQKYHGAGGPSPDMAIPVVDLKQVGVLSKLASLGIRAVIPLSQLHSGAGNGMFGLPVVAVDAANNPAICNIGGLGASNLLPLGPLKNLTFSNNTPMR